MGSIEFSQIMHYDLWRVNLCLTWRRTIMVTNPGNSWNSKNWNRALEIYLHSTREHSLVIRIAEKEIPALAGILELFNNKLFHWWYSKKLCFLWIYPGNPWNKFLPFWSRNIIAWKTSFWPCHSKFKRPRKSAALKGNPFYQLTSNFTFTNILKYK